MKTKKPTAPFELLVVILEQGHGEKVEELLKANNIFAVFHLQGRGTAENTFQDVFNFSVVDRDVVAALVDAKRAKALVEIIHTDLNLQIENNGFAFTVKPTSATKDVIDLVGGIL